MEICRHANPVLKKSLGGLLVAVCALDLVLTPMFQIRLVGTVGETLYMSYGL